MSHNVHQNHNHEHGKNCGHIAIQHGDHIDYIHEGHLHHLHEGHYDECLIEVSTINPDTCTQGHTCSGHEVSHVHGVNCGHPQVPHGDHIDYLVDGHLHHYHNGHCDNHGKIQIIG